MSQQESSPNASGNGKSLSQENDQNSVNDGSKAIRFTTTKVYEQ
jgi:hypothetical protein